MSSILQLWWPPFSLILSLPRLFICADPLSVLLGMRSGPLGPYPKRLGKLRSHFSLTLSYGEIADCEVSLGSELCCFGGRVTHVRKNYSYLLQWIYSHIFLHWGIGTSQLDSQAPIKVFSSISVCYNWFSKEVWGLQPPFSPSNWCNS